MPEPLTLAAVSAVVLAEGVKFLYGQAGDALKRWRERRAAATPNAETAATPRTIAMPVPAGVFAGVVESPVPHDGVLDDLGDELAEARRAVSDLADDTEHVDPDNAAHLSRIEALRSLMEAVLQQRLTFQGEDRPPSGPVAQGEIDVGTVRGYAAGLRVRTMHDGTATGKAHAVEVAQGGELTGLDVGEMGR